MHHLHIFKAKLSEFKWLVELNLEGCVQLGENTIDSIIQYCRMIENLNISMLEDIDDNLVDKIAINLSDLKELYVDHCQKVTDKSFKYLARELRETLAKLSIRCNKNITNNGLIYFSENMMALSTLNLTACVSFRGTIYIQKINILSYSLTHRSFLHYHITFACNITNCNKLRRHNLMTI